MKTRQFMTSLTWLALNLLGLAPAYAQQMDNAYYTREVVRRCQNQAENTAKGVAVGTAIGASMGFLLGERRVGAAVAGGVAAGVVGGILGFGLSCNDEERYIESVETHLSRQDYRESSVYQDDRMRCTILRSGYTPNREICRTYRSEILTPRGWLEKEETACFVGGMWRHGYEGVIITEELWHREPPPRRAEVIVIERPRHRAHAAERFDRRHEDRYDGRHEGRRDHHAPLGGRAFN